MSTISARITDIDVTLSPLTKAGDVNYLKFSNYFNTTLTFLKNRSMVSITLNLIKLIIDSLILVLISITSNSLSLLIIYVYNVYMSYPDWE
jgi:hypothetical protein